MPAPERAADPPLIATLVDVLKESLLALADADRAEQANRLAATAYVGLRRSEPVQAQRINALMHKLCRMP